MSWTYRIVKMRVKDDLTDAVRYAIHEVYYGDADSEPDKSATIQELDQLGLSWTENPVDPHSFVDQGEKDDPEEQREFIKDILRKMLKACDYPIVDGGDA